MMDETRRETLEDALGLWGAPVQEDVAIEEMGELTTELMRNRRGRDDVDVIDEIADVQLCLDQLKLMYGESAVAEREARKLYRLRQRIAEGAL